MNERHAGDDSYVVRNTSNNCGAMDESGRLPQFVNAASPEIAELRRSQQYYRSIVADQIDPICRFRLDGTYTFANHIYCQYFGKYPDQILTRNLFDCCDLAERDRMVQHLASYSIDKPIDTYENQLVMPNGEVRWHQWICKALFDCDGNVVEFQAVGRDITKFKQLELDAIATIEKAQSANCQQSWFIQMLFNELGNPLTAISLTAQNLINYGEKITKHKKQKCFRKIVNACDQITEIIDDAKILTKANFGKLEFKPIAIDLESFCRHLVAEIHAEQRICDQGNELSLIKFSYVGDRQPVSCDPQLLKLIIGNLLTNALKYSKCAQPVIFKVTNRSGAIEVQVCDRGIGIPTQDLADLYEPFRRASNASDFKGSGLGLSIVKTAIEAYDGQIQVESELGKGTKFTVTLAAERTSN
jgi:PAS domain S-box-containing protein